MYMDLYPIFRVLPLLFLLSFVYDSFLDHLFLPPVVSGMEGIANLMKDPQMMAMAQQVTPLEAVSSYVPSIISHNILVTYNL